MATREQLIEDFADHKYATGEKFERLINSMKVVQEPVSDPAASGTSLSFIDSIEQDADGKITATKKTLDLSNAHELNPFKGWWKTGDTLPTSGFDGAYLYFKDTTQTPAVTTIYQWNGTAYADTGTEVDESNVNTFGSGQQVNAVKIMNEKGNEDAGAEGVLSAEAGAKLSKKVADEFGHAVKTLAINNGAYVKFFDTSIKADTIFGIDISSNKDWTRVIAIVNRGKENESRIIDETTTRRKRMAIFKADRTIESITVCVTTADSSQSDVTVEVCYNLERRLDSFETTGKALVTTPIIPFVLQSGKKLGFNGGSVTDASYQLIKYRVYTGDVLKVTASKDSAITLLFQDQENVPMNMSNTHIVGRTFSVSLVDELIEVPLGATYMIVSQLIRDSVTYSVERVFKDDAVRGIDTVYSEPVRVISSNYSFCHVLRFEEGEHYQIEVSLSDALSSILGVSIRTTDGVSLDAFSLQAGTTTRTFNYVAPQTYEGVIIGYSFSGTAAGTISIRVSSRGMIARLADAQDSVDNLQDNPYVIAVNRKLDTINDLVDNYSGLANDDYVLIGKQLFIKITDSTALPNGGYVWDNSILKRGVVYNVGGAVYVYDGVNVVKSVCSIAEISQSTNLYDESRITIGRAIDKSGTITPDNNYLVTDYIRVEEGDILSCWWKKDSEFSYFTKPKMRHICAFGYNKNVIANAGASELTSYTVPSGIVYVRITLYKNGDINGAIFKSDGVTRKVGFRINKGAIKPYEDYFYGLAPKWVYETKHNVDEMLGEPLGMMTEDIVKTLSYKRLGGPLEHGYLILSTDDGGADMARYTVPLAINKEIPVSFCIMSASHCLRTDLYQVEGDNTTPTLRDMVLDAVNNHGCEIIQHGAIPWAANSDNSNQHYSLWELREFFASEKAFWSTLNVDVRGAAIPEFATSNAVKIITGGLFGMCRCAYYEGTNPTTHVFESGGQQYTMYFNGPKSNLYCLTSQNYTDFPLAALKAAVDYAVLHNYILIFHFHERELDEAKKEKLEDLIDYAKTTDIVFTKLGDVPYLD